MKKTYEDPGCSLCFFHFKSRPFHPHILTSPSQMAPMNACHPRRLQTSRLKNGVLSWTTRNFQHGWGSKNGISMRPQWPFVDHPFFFSGQDLFPFIQKPLVHPKNGYTIKGWSGLKLQLQPVYGIEPPHPFNAMSHLLISDHSSYFLGVENERCEQSCQTVLYHQSCTFVYPICHIYMYSLHIHIHIHIYIYIYIYIYIHIYIYVQYDI